MASNLFRTSIFIAGAFFLFILGTSVSQAHRAPSVCEGQSGKAFGLCRAAVASGCASVSTTTNSHGYSHGRHLGHSKRHHGKHRYCSRLGRYFTSLTGLDPIWETPVSTEPVPVPVPVPVPLAVPVTDPITTDNTTTNSTTTNSTTTTTIDMGSITGVL